MPKLPGFSPAAPAARQVTGKGLAAKGRRTIADIPCACVTGAREKTFLKDEVAENDNLHRRTLTVDETTPHQKGFCSFI